MSIRWKMLLTIGVPVFAVYCAVIGLALHELRAQARAQAEEETTLLARGYALALGGELERMAQVAASTAQLLELGTDLDRDGLFEVVTGNLEHDPLVYGSCIAFEPRAFRDYPGLFAPYAYRAAEGTRVIDLSAEAYDYTDGRWEWYARPRETGRGAWTEPYFDEGAGNILMSTYSAPFFAGGKFMGVATVDIPLEDLQEHLGIDEHGEGFFFILSPTGTFISARDPEIIMEKTIFDVAKELDRPEFLELGRRMTAGMTGVTETEGLAVAGKQWISYTPIGDTGWSFAEVMTAEVATAFYREQFRAAAAALGLTLALMLLVIYLASGLLSRPIQRLAGGVRRLAGGDLETRVEGSSGGDEIGELTRGFNRMVGELREHLDALTRETAARQAVESELNIAREIQTSLLPRIFPPYPNRPEFDLFAVNTAAKQVAGDFYDFVLLDDRHLYFVIADVSGKGVPAALYMAITRTVLRDHVADTRDPATILAHTNALLSADNENSMFVTLFLGIYDTQTGEIAFSNGGHPHPQVVRPDGSVYTFSEENSLMVGLLPEAEFWTSRGRLEPGERLFLFTDGIPEAQNPAGRFLEDQGVVELLTGRTEDTLEAFCSAVVDEVAAFEAGAQSDDVTVMMLERRS